MTFLEWQIISSLQTGSSKRTKYFMRHDSNQLAHLITQISGGNEHWGMLGLIFLSVLYNPLINSLKVMPGSELSNNNNNNKNKNNKKNNNNQKNVKINSADVQFINPSFKADLKAIWTQKPHEVTKWLSLKPIVRGIIWIVIFLGSWLLLDSYILRYLLLMLLNIIIIIIVNYYYY